jgi:hypothetical protein
VPECSLLAGTQSSRIAKSGRPVAAQIWNDDPPPGCGERGRDIIISVHVIRKPVHQDGRWAIGWTRFLVGNFQCRSQDRLHIAPARLNGDTAEGVSYAAEAKLAAPSSAAFRTPCQSRNPTVLLSSSMYRIGPKLVKYSTVSSGKLVMS